MGLMTMHSNQCNNQLGDDIPLEHLYALHGYTQWRVLHRCLEQATQEIQGWVVCRYRQAKGVCLPGQKQPMG